MPLLVLSHDQLGIISLSACDPPVFTHQTHNRWTCAGHISARQQLFPEISTNVTAKGVERTLFYAVKMAGGPLSNMGNSRFKSVTVSTELSNSHSISKEYEFVFGCSEILRMAGAGEK